MCPVDGNHGNGILPNLEASSYHFDALHPANALHDYAEQGAEFAAIEASSYGLEQCRLNGCDIESGLQ